MKEKLLLGILMIVVGVLIGCTQPGETTGVSSAAGGVIGAGLGAIVGSQTGSAGAGLAIGAAAGSGTGALIGNAIEAQHVAIRSQDEALERQEQVIRAQAAEIEELKRLSQDSISYNDRAPDAYAAPEISPRAGMRPFNSASSFNGVATARRQPIQESSLVIPESLKQGANQGAHVKARDFTETIKPQAPQSLDSSGVQRGSYAALVQSEPLPSSNLQKPKTLGQLPEQGNEKVSEFKQEIEQESEKDSSSSQIARNVDGLDMSSDCKDAEKEIAKAQSVVDAADKLFHFRRALRLCPHQPSHHNGLGEVYNSLGRMEDARFEFQEALKLNPNYAPAQSNLKKLNSLDGAVG